MGVRAWQAHDTGLVAVLPRFRRLGGLVRHHQGAGPRWPAEVDLEVDGGRLVVRTVDGVELGRWSASARQVSPGPPVQLVVDLGDDGQVLLSAPSAPETSALLAALASQ
jgi:hypothetical protein